MVTADGFGIDTPFYDGDDCSIAPSLKSPRVSGRIFTSDETGMIDCLARVERRAGDEDCIALSEKHSAKPPFHATYHCIY